MGRKYYQLEDKLKNREGYARIRGGSVAEWLKAHDSKSCGRVNRLEGSNPFASAITNAILAFF